MFYASFIKEKILSYLPKKVLILNIDNPITQTERKLNGEYNTASNGYIPATYFDKEKFRRSIEIAIKFRIPTHLVTTRPDTIENRQLLRDLIIGIDGFHASIGGIKQDTIHFTATMVKHNDKLICESVITKAELIQQIHKTRYAHLHPSAILYVDDIETFLNSVKALGYRTTRSNSQTLSHFDEIEKFMEPSLEMEGYGRKLHSGPVKLGSFEEHKSMKR